MGNINQLGICWKSDTVRRKESQLLECIDDNFLRHMTEQVKRGDVLLA